MIDLKPACQAVTDLLGGITDEQLASPTPCREYSVGDLLDHLDIVTVGATALARRDADGLGGPGRPVGAAHLGPHWRSDVADHLEALGKAWDDPAVWEGSGNVPGSDLTDEVWGKITLTELVVHGWDLARATRQPFDLPDQTLRVCLDHVATFVPNAPFPALWGPPVEVASDAPMLDRIVAITGRTP